MLHQSINRVRSLITPLPYPTLPYTTSPEAYSRLLVVRFALLCFALMLIWCCRGWRPSHTAEAAAFALSGLWKAVRPPPDLLAATSSTARMVAGWCCCCCCRGFKSMRRGRRRRRAKAALKRLGSGLGLGSPTPKIGAGDGGRWAAVFKSSHFWSFKVRQKLAEIVRLIDCDVGWVGRLVDGCRRSQTPNFEFPPEKLAG